MSRDRGAMGGMTDIAKLFDAIDSAFGRNRRASDYSLAEGEIVTLGSVEYVVRSGDFVDPDRATAAELACCLQVEGADCNVVDDDEIGFKRVDPRPKIRPPKERRIVGYFADGSTTIAVQRNTYEDGEWLDLKYCQALDINPALIGPDVSTDLVTSALGVGHFWRGVVRVLYSTDV